MELKSFETIIDALNANNVRFLLVGGMAVVAHGYGRMTHDLDLVVQLEAENIGWTFAALEGLGYRPRAPVTAADFADPQKRRSWIEEKGMTVLNLYSDHYPTTPVDIFVAEPFDFDQAFEDSLQTEVEGSVFRYVDLQTLIAMKEIAGRPIDKEDIRQLKMLQEDQSDD